MSKCKKCRDEEPIEASEKEVKIVIYDDEIDVEIPLYWGSASTTFQINYCPFCGREL